MENIKNGKEEVEQIHLWLVWRKKNTVKTLSMSTAVRGKFLSWIIAELFNSQYYFKVYSCCPDNSIQYNYV